MNKPVVRPASDAQDPVVIRIVDKKTGALLRELTASRADAEKVEVEATRNLDPFQYSTQVLSSGAATPGEA